MRVNPPGQSSKRHQQSQANPDAIGPIVALIVVVVLLLMLIPY